MMGSGRLARLLNYRRARGQAVFEFVVLLYPFILLTLLVVEFGAFGYRLISVTGAVREAARFAAADCPALVPPGDTQPGCQVASADVQRYAAQRSDGAAAPGDVLVYWCDRPPTNTAPQPDRGDSVVVSVSKPYTGLILPIPALPIFARVDALVENPDPLSTLPQSDGATPGPC
jgi:Flp pilus assembly protein TadG